jgi:hypothetical protein
VPRRRKAERKAMNPMTSTAPLKMIIRRCARGDARIPPTVRLDEDDSIRIETKVPEES